jgi:hypothetical protein
MKLELHRRENMPPEMYANLKEFREKYPSEWKSDMKAAALMEKIFGKRMYALLSSEVRELKLEVKHGKANFELGGEGWRPVLIANTEEELAAEIRCRELRPDALRHKVTEAIATFTD